MGRYAKLGTTTKQPTLKQLLDEQAQGPRVAQIEDTLSDEEIKRLRPLAWLIKNQGYSLKEVIKCQLAYDEQRSSIRAQEIVDLIRQRKLDKAAGK